jgi:hypothetical protein
MDKSLAVYTFFANWSFSQKMCIVALHVGQACADLLGTLQLPQTIQGHNDSSPPEEKDFPSEKGG